MDTLNSAYSNVKGIGEKVVLKLEQHKMLVGVLVMLVILVVGFLVLLVVWMFFKRKAEQSECEKVGGSWERGKCFAFDGAHPVQWTKSCNVVPPYIESAGDVSSSCSKKRDSKLAKAFTRFDPNYSQFLAGGGENKESYADESNHGFVELNGKQIKMHQPLENDSGHIGPLHLAPQQYMPVAANPFATQASKISSPVPY